MKKLLLLSSIAIASVWFSGCSENAVTPDPTPTTSYFPTNTNSSYVIKVDWFKPDQSVDFSYQDSIVLGTKFNFMGKEAVRAFRWGTNASSGQKMVFDSIPQSNEGNAAWYYHSPVSFQGLSTYTIPALWCKLGDFSTSSSNSWVVYNDTIPSIPVSLSGQTLQATNVGVNQTITKTSDTTIQYKGASVVVKRTIIRSTITATLMGQKIPPIVVEEYAGFAQNIGRILLSRDSKTIDLSITTAPIAGFRYTLQNHTIVN